MPSLFLLRLSFSHVWTSVSVCFFTSSSVTTVCYCNCHEKKLYTTRNSGWDHVHQKDKDIPPSCGSVPQDTAKENKEREREMPFPVPSLMNCISIHLYFCFLRIKFRISTASNFCMSIIYCLGRREEDTTKPLQVFQIKNSARS
jgi:hypothetical protein